MCWAVNAIVWAGGTRLPFDSLQHFGAWLLQAPITPPCPCEYFPPWEQHSQLQTTPLGAGLRGCWGSQPLHGPQPCPWSVTLCPGQGSSTGRGWREAVAAPGRVCFYPPFPAKAPGAASLNIPGKETLLLVTSGSFSTPRPWGRRGKRVVQCRK